MFLNKLKIAAALLLATAMVGTGATLLLRAASHAESPEAAERPNIGPGPVEIPGDPLPKGVVARMGTTQLRHGDAIFFAAYLPGGDAVVTAGKDQTVRLWNLASGKEVRRFDWGRIETTSAPEPLTDMLRQKIDQQNLDDIALSSQVAVSSDGRTVAASRGGTVCLWKIANGKPIRQLQTGQSRLAYLAFSADGKSLLTAGPSGKVAAIWEVATGQCVRRSEAPLPPGHDNGVMPIVEQSVVASPSLRYLAYQWRHPTGSKSLHIRDLATGSELPAIELGGYAGPLPCCFSADDKTLVWVDWFFGGGIVFSEVATGKEQRRLGDLRKYDARVDNTEPTLAIALSADGKYVASCRSSHTIELWDLASGRSMYPVGRPTKLQLLERFTNSVGARVRPALAFSPDSKRLVCSLGGAAIRQFRSDTGEEIPGPGSEHHAAVSTLALSTDCKSLWTFGSGESARCWDWATGGEAKRLDVPAGATHVAFARDGRFAYAVGNYVTVATDAGKKSWKVAGDWPPLEALALSPDGKLLATRNYETPEVNVWDATGKKRYTLESGSDSPLPGGTGAGETAGVVTPELVFSPDGQRLAGAGPRRQLCVWDVANGSLLWEVFPQIGQAIERLAFSPNGSGLAVVHTDRTISLYESSTGGRRGRFGEADARHSKSYMAEDYYGGRFRLARTTRAAPVCLAFSPNSRFLAMAKDTPTIQLWDVLTGREVCQLKGHEGGIASLLFAPDGRHLFSGGIDTTALSWDLTGKVASSDRREPPAGRGFMDPASLWADLASQDADRAFDALRQLSASPADAVTLIEQHLLPLASVDEKRLDRLLADLGSEHLEVRHQAESEFVQLGKRSEPALRKALSEEQPLLVRQRLQCLLNNIHTLTAQQMRASRAVELLELIGSPEAQQLLQTLATGDPTAPLTRQTKSALQRLSR